MIFDLPLPEGASKLTPATAPVNNWTMENSTAGAQSLTSQLENSTVETERAMFTEEDLMDEDQTTEENSTFGAENSSVQADNSTSNQENLMDVTETAKESSMNMNKMMDMSSANAKTSMYVDKTPENSTQNEDCSHKNGSTGLENSIDEAPKVEITKDDTQPPKYKFDLYMEISSDEEGETKETPVENATESSTLFLGTTEISAKPKPKVTFSELANDIDESSEESEEEDVVAMIDRQELLQYESSLKSKISVHPYTFNPTKAWEMLQVKQTFEKVKPLDLGTPVFADKVKRIFFPPNFVAKIAMQKLTFESYIVEIHLNTIF